MRVLKTNRKNDAKEHNFPSESCFDGTFYKTDHAEKVFDENLI